MKKILRAAACFMIALIVSITICHAKIIDGIYVEEGSRQTTKGSRDSSEPGYDALPHGRPYYLTNSKWDWSEDQTWWDETKTDYETSADLSFDDEQGWQGTATKKETTSYEEESHAHWMDVWADGPYDTRVIACKIDYKGESTKIEKATLTCEEGICEECHEETYEMDGKWTRNCESWGERNSQTVQYDYETTTEEVPVEDDYTVPKICYQREDYSCFNDWSYLFADQDRVEPHESAYVNEEPECYGRVLRYEVEQPMTLVHESHAPNWDYNQYDYDEISVDYRWHSCYDKELETELFIDSSSYFAIDPIINLDRAAIQKDDEIFYMMGRMERSDKIGCEIKVNEIEADEEITKFKLLDESGNVIAEEDVAKWQERECYMPGCLISWVIFEDESLYEQDKIPRGEKLTCVFEGSSTLKPKPIPLILLENRKDESRYSESTVFSVSEDDWRNVLSSIPATLWYNESFGRDYYGKTQGINMQNEWCQHTDDVMNEEGELEPSKKCAYPLIVHAGNPFTGSHYKSEIWDSNVPGYDFDRFMLDYDIQDVREGRFWKEQWKSAGVAVVVDYNDYKTGLLAAQFASYFNAPLVFVGQENRNEWQEYLDAKALIIIGSLEAGIAEELKEKNAILEYDDYYNFRFPCWYGYDSVECDFPAMTLTSDELQDLLFDLVRGSDLGYKSDKGIVVTNPNDIENEFCEDGEFCKMSLFAPMLAFDKDCHMGFLDNDKVTSFHELQRLDKELEEELGKENPSETVIDGLFDEEETIDNEIRGAAESIGGKLWTDIFYNDDYYYSYISDYVMFLGGPTAIPISTSTISNLDAFYVDEDGYLQECECEIEPDKDYDRFYHRTTADMSAKIAQHLIGFPECAACEDGSCEWPLTGGAVMTTMSGKKEEVDPIAEYLAGLIYEYRHDGGMAYLYHWIRGDPGTTSEYLISKSGSSSNNRPDYQPLSRELERILVQQKDTKITTLEEDRISCPLNKQSRIYSYSSESPMSGRSVWLKTKINLDTFEQNLAIAHYYSIMNRFRQGIFSKIDAIAAANRLLSTQSIAPIQLPELNDYVKQMFPEVEAYRCVISGGFGCSLSDLDPETKQRYLNLQKHLTEMDLDKLSKATKSVLIKLQEEHNVQIYLKAMYDYYMDVAMMPRLPFMDDPAEGSTPELKHTRFGIFLMRPWEIGKHSVEPIDWDVETFQRERWTHNYRDWNPELLEKVYDFVKGDTLADTIKNIGKALPGVKDSRSASKSAFYWVNGKVFGDTFDHDLTNTESAFIAQLKENRQKAQEDIGKIQDAIECIHTPSSQLYSDPANDNTRFEACSLKVDRAFTVSPFEYRLNEVQSEFYGPGLPGEKALEETEKQIVNMWFSTAEDAQRKHKDILNTNKIVSEIALIAAVAIATFGVGTAASGVFGALTFIAQGSLAKGFIGLALMGYHYLHGVPAAVTAAWNACSGQDIQPGENAVLNIGPVRAVDDSACFQSAFLAGIYIGGLIAAETVSALKFFRLEDTSLYKHLTEKPAVKPAVKGGCFLEDTSIKMADGSYKDIEDIQIGEKVMAYDIENDQPVAADVTTTFVRNETSYRIIEYEIIEE